MLEYRLDKRAVSLLETMAERTGKTKTEILEWCIRCAAESFPGAKAAALNAASEYVLEKMREAVPISEVTGHTAAIYWLAVERDAAAVAENLGHDVRTLRRHYLALVTREQAAEFWRVTPTLLRTRPGSPA